jgi:hypothetical protein
LLTGRQRAQRKRCRKSPIDQCHVRFTSFDERFCGRRFRPLVSGSGGLDALRLHCEARAPGGSAAR